MHNLQLQRNSEHAGFHTSTKLLHPTHDDYICLWLQTTNFSEDAHMLGYDAVLLN